MNIKTRLNPKYSSAELKYYFNDRVQSSPSLETAYPVGVIDIKVEAWSDGKKIATLNL